MNPYLIIGFLGALIASFITGGTLGYRYADNSAEVKAQNTLISQRDKVISELQSQIARNVAVNNKYAADLAESEKAIGQLKKVVDDYAEEFGQVAASCLLDDTAVGRLRSIGAPARPGRQRSHSDP